MNSSNQDMKLLERVLVTQNESIDSLTAQVEAMKIVVRTLNEKLNNVKINTVNNTNANNDKLSVL